MIVLDGYSLTLADVVKVARGYETVGLSEVGRKQIVDSRKIVDKILEEETPVYGISTVLVILARFLFLKKNGKSCKET